MVKIGVIGVGRWGINYLRILNGISGVNVNWICSRTEESIKNAIEKSNIKTPLNTTTDYRTILEDKNVDAVAIATSGSTHFRIAKDALEAGKHVLVEKPMTLSSGEAEKLIRSSEQKNRVLMAGHLHIFNPGIKRIKEDIQQGLFGKIKHVSMTHAGNIPRTDIGALWDYGPHFVSIALNIFDKNPISANAASSFFNNGVEGIANINLNFSGNVSANLFCGWIFPFKKMELTVVGEKLTAVFDDYAENMENKLKYYDSAGNILNQKVENKKPLTEELMHFVDCIRHNKKPATSGEEALNVARVLEACYKSLANENKTINIC